MADCNYALEGWEWDSIFTSSLIEHDLQWNNELSDPDSINLAATSLLASIDPSSFPSSVATANFRFVQHSEKSREEGDEYGTPIASSAVVATNTSDGSLESSSYNHDTPISSQHLPSSKTSLTNPLTGSFSKKKKRDPRLECPNFLAGRIPCSCPEEDEMEEDIEVATLVKKRSKVGARCQVPSCGEDISHLKGYHQRHRVCLECANSIKVMLKDQPHRYCQQCGKFHRLSDFDEGKRSCRRKLERHNKRRRRRPVEGEGEGQDSQAPLLGNDIDSSNLHRSSEGAATQNAHNAANSIGCNQGMTLARAKLKKEGPSSREVRDTVPPVLNGSDTLSINILQREEVEGVIQDFANPVTDDQHGSEDSSGSIRTFNEEKNCSNKGKVNEHCLLNVVRGNNDQKVQECERSTKHSPKSGTQRTSTVQRRFATYVSPCPTGRISFKLYDWNPADFPRRLRQQIFEWLASMPVELESYVRSGCIILTFFLSMPQVMWVKVLAEWKGQVQTLILKSGVKLLGIGQLTTPMMEKRLCLKNGKVTSACCKDRSAPVVLDLYPRSLEPGRPVQLYVYGLNFSGGRFLLSFGEQYVQCSDWELAESSHFRDHPVQESFNNLEVQKVTVVLPDSEKFGLAFVEVENAYGISNYMPILVADKYVCSEINSTPSTYASSAAFDINLSTSDKEAKAVNSQVGMDMLTDLGWALKYMNKHHAIRVDEKETLIRRLQSLLLFTSEHQYHAVTQRLVQIVLNNFVISKVYYFQVSDVWNITNTTKDLKALSTSGLPHFHYETAVKGHFNPTLAAEADSTRAIYKLSQAKGLQGRRPALEQMLLTQSTMVEGSHECSFASVEVPLLEERVSIIEDGWRNKASWAWSLNRPRKPLAIKGTSLLCSRKRKFGPILVATVGIVMVCTGMCLLLQHPHEVAEISMSLRRCLWGSTDLNHA